MTRIGHLFTFGVLALAAPLAGQGSRNMDAFATVVVSPTLSLAKIQDLNFGTHFASEGKVPNTAGGNAAFFDGSTDPGSCVTLAYSTLPKQLTRAGSTDFVPVFYGMTSGAVSTGGAALSFNPDGGGVADHRVASDGFFQVYLGLPQGNGDTDLVTVDLTGARAGTYSATIMLTVMAEQCPAP